MQPDEIEARLQEARGRLAGLTREIAELMVTGDAGSKRLIALRRDRDEARGSIDELESALALATLRKEEAEQDRQAAAREKQFEQFRAAADAWMAKGKELADKINAAARTRVEFGLLTEKLELALPTGIIPHAVNFRMLDSMLDGAVFPADIDVLIAGEAYKHGAPGAALPGARPPVMSQLDNRPAIEPLSAAIQRARNYFVRLLRDRLDALKQLTKEAA
jgi:hypothetical protein